jgi:translation initiation factor 2 beta subunit (eIF-2beta)/eIF-5
LKDYLKKSKKDIIFTIKKKFSEKEITLKIGNYYKLLEFVKIKNTTEKQLLLRKKWSQ